MVARLTMPFISIRAKKLTSEGEGVHHEPVFSGLQQPDDHGGQKDHQDATRRAQGGQPAQEAAGKAQDFLRSVPAAGAE